MEYNYWLDRSVHAFGMAQSATSSKTRLIHLELAGAYSVRAAGCDERPADWNAIGRTTPQAPTAGARAGPDLRIPSSPQPGGVRHAA